MFWSVDLLGSAVQVQFLEALHLLRGRVEKLGEVIVRGDERHGKP
jgi:hypothetical protein